MALQVGPKIQDADARTRRMRLSEALRIVDPSKKTPPPSPVPVTMTGRRGRKAKNDRRREAPRGDRAKLGVAAGTAFASAILREARVVGIDGPSDWQRLVVARDPARWALGA